MAKAPVRVRSSFVRSLSPTKFPPFAISIGTMFFVGDSQSPPLGGSLTHEPRHLSGDIGGSGATTLLLNWSMRFVGQGLSLLNCSYDNSNTNRPPVPSPTA